MVLLLVMILFLIRAIAFWIEGKSATALVFLIFMTIIRTFYYGEELRLIVAIINLIGHLTFVLILSRMLHKEYE